MSESTRSKFVSRRACAACFRARIEIRLSVHKQPKVMKIADQIEAGRRPLPNESFVEPLGFALPAFAVLNDELLEPLRPDAGPTGEHGALGVHVRHVAVVCSCLLECSHEPELARVEKAQVVGKVRAGVTLRWAKANASWAIAPTFPVALAMRPCSAANPLAAGCALGRDTFSSRTAAYLK